MTNCTHTCKSCLKAEAALIAVPINATEGEPKWWPRFAAKFTVNDQGCWQWHGATVPQGYGKLGMNGTVEYSHRVAYEWFVGPIGDGLEIDHLCQNRACCNPDHLEAVTHAVNMTRRREARLARIAAHAA